MSTTVFATTTGGHIWRNEMAYLSTGQVANLLNVNVHRIGYLTRDRQIRPLKGPTGVFLWTYQEVATAARLLTADIPSEADFNQAADWSTHN